jgi:hypothetical protein
MSIEESMSFERKRENIRVSVLYHVLDSTFSGGDEIYFVNHGASGNASGSLKQL